jgi:hypothetical protein
MPAPKGHKAYPAGDGTFSGGAPQKYTKEFIEGEATAFEAWMNRPESIYFKGFALERGYHPQRLTEFAEKNERFSDVYRRAQAWQENKLVTGGLTNLFNAGFTKFVMGNTCGWVDRQQTQVSGDLTNPLAILLSKIDGASKELIDA